MAKNNLLENLCPRYQNLLGSALILCEYARNDAERGEILKEFSQKHFLLPEFWKKFVSVNQWIKIPHKEDTKSILYYYFVKFHLATLTGRCRVENLKWHPEFILLQRLQQSKNYEASLKRIENSFEFSYETMEDFYEGYVNYGAQPVTDKVQKSYEKSWSLQKEFKDAGESDKKWLNCIKKLENEKVVVANIELRLGSKSSCTNKEIWKYYIEYLRDRDSKAMLEVYLRYCRFFVSDGEMLEEYRKEIERIGKLKAVSVSIFWIDTIEWELDFGDLEMANSLLKTAVKGVLEKQEIPNLTTKETFENFFHDCKKQLKLFESKGHLPDSDKTFPKPIVISSSNDDDEIPAKPESRYFKKSKSYQSLSIPTFLAKYITKNANSILLSKLYRTSKYFYSILSAPICHRLVIHKHVTPRYFQQSLFLQDSNLNFLGSQKLILSKSLSFCSAKISTDISSFISKLHKCDATHIYFCSLILTKKQLEFFVSSGKIESIRWISLTVLDENHVSLNYEEIKNFIESFGNKLKNGEIMNWYDVEICGAHSSF